MPRAAPEATARAGVSAGIANAGNAVAEVACAARRTGPAGVPRAARTALADVHSAAVGGAGIAFADLQRAAGGGTGITLADGRCVARAATAGVAALIGRGEDMPRSGAGAEA